MIFMKIEALARRVQKALSHAVYECSECLQQLQTLSQICDVYSEQIMSRAQNGKIYETKLYHGRR